MTGKLESKYLSRIKILEQEVLKGSHQSRTNILFLAAVVIANGGKLTINESEINAASGVELAIDMDTAMRTIVLKVNTPEPEIVLDDSLPNEPDTEFLPSA